MKKIKRIRQYITVVFLLACTIISGFGICTAPESDEKKLKQELEQNALLLEQTQTAFAVPKESSAQTTEKTTTISVIGDSVFLGAAPAFQKIQKNVVINAKISRQVYHGIDVAKQMQKKGTLGNTVIISLGTNGNFNPATGQELIDYLGANREIYWINVYGKNIRWQKKVNKTMKELAKKHKNVHVIDWAKTAKKHADWFYQDGTHLNTKGQEGFAKFIKKKVK